jgi:hypothetical protein
MIAASDDLAVTFTVGCNVNLSVKGLEAMTATKILYFPPKEGGLSRKYLLADEQLWRDRALFNESQQPDHFANALHLIVLNPSQRWIGRNQLYLGGPFAFRSFSVTSSVTTTRAVQRARIEQLLCKNSCFIFPAEMKKLARTAGSLSKQPVLQPMNAEMKAESPLKTWYPRQGLNLRPFAPEANALIH